jgi:arginyl-tRNA synthetase
MLLAPALKAPPREIAEKLGAALQERLGAQVDHVEVAGPGFLNIFLADDWYTGAAAHVLAAGDGYGGGTADPPEKIQVEFVSANPTGPLTAASGRHAAYGDSLRRLFRFQGHEVEGEYYFNDAGAQIRKFGESIIARARGEEPPEGGYQGEYVTELAREIPDAAELDADTVAAEGVSRIVERIRSTLASYHVEFDNWFREASLHEGDPSPVQRALADLPRASPTAPTTRCGCGPRSSAATTRTACWCAARASRPTSRPTSPTWSPSSSAASTASSSCSAPTTTATSRA